MCGRYAIVSSSERLQAHFRATNPPPAEGRPWDDVAPLRSAPVVRRRCDTGERGIDLLRWGLSPSFIADPKGGRRPIAAPAETVSTAGLFRYAFARQLCLVPGDFFYELRPAIDGEDLFAIGRADGAPLAFAGLWEAWRAPDDEVIYSYAIITTVASPAMEGLSDRMPVILEEADWPLWLGEVKADVTALLRPPRDGVIRVSPVSEVMAA